jgi:hypothetical protein
MHLTVTIAGQHRSTWAEDRESTFGEIFCVEFICGALLSM